MAKETESKITVKMLGAVAGILVAMLSAIAGGFVYIDNRYVNEDVYELHLETYRESIATIDTKTAQVITAMQEQNQTDLNLVYKAIKDASALPLIVRRDILIARGNSMTNAEKAELEILREKLNDLNVE